MQSLASKLAWPLFQLMLICNLDHRSIPPTLMGQKHWGIHAKKIDFRRGSFVSVWSSILDPQLEFGARKYSDPFRARNPNGASHFAVE
jgi:hypothetical protein